MIAIKGSRMRQHIQLAMEQFEHVPDLLIRVVTIASEQQPLRVVEYFDDAIEASERAERAMDAGGACLSFEVFDRRIDDDSTEQR